MSKLIQKNPYREDTSSGSIWAMGFYAGQRSINDVVDEFERLAAELAAVKAELATVKASSPVSVTGRWWQAKDGRAWFIQQAEYISIQITTDFNLNECRWLTEEETREFK